MSITIDQHILYIMYDIEYFRGGTAILELILKF